jgi:hypothetical protein
LRAALVDCQLGWLLQIHADGNEQLQPRGAVAVTLDQVETHSGLAGRKLARDRRPAQRGRTARLEAELLPVSVGDVLGFALPAGRDFGGFRLARLLLRRDVPNRSWSGNGGCE